MSSHTTTPTLTTPSPTGQWTGNPIVQSMIACNTMHNCEEVKGIYQECAAKNKKDSMMCEVAQKYWKMCHMNKNGETSSVLDHTPYVEP